MVMVVRVSKDMTSNRQRRSNGWSLLFSFSVVISVLVFLQLDVALILRTASLSLFALGSFTLFLYLFGDQLKAFWKQLFHRHDYQERQTSGLSAEDFAIQQNVARERIQHEYQEKAAKFEEEVLRPRQEAKKSKQEEEFYKFAGAAWKGKSHRLVDADNGENRSEKPSPRKRAQRTSKDAAEARKLPESVTRPVDVEPDQTIKLQRRIIVLPDEPEVTDKECITVAMRGLRSQIKKRRFLFTEKIQVLLDWMTKQGYHPKLYTVCTTFPRRDLAEHVGETMEAMSITRDVMLVVEERED